MRAKGVLCINLPTMTPRTVIHPPSRTPRLITHNPMVTIPRPTVLPLDDRRLISRRESASVSSVCLRPQSSALRWSMATPAPVSPHLSSFFYRFLLFPHHLIFVSFLFPRLRAGLYAPQGCRRWVLRHRVPRRLAHPLAPQYTLIGNAVWCRCESRVEWKASCCVEEDEEKQRRRLG